MKTIWKYPIKPITVLQIPPDAKILCVQMQGSIPCIWALLDPHSSLTTRRCFRTVGTGHDVPDDPGEYIGTFQAFGGDLVFHVFEVLQPDHLKPEDWPDVMIKPLG